MLDINCFYVSSLRRYAINKSWVKKSSWKWGWPERWEQAALKSMSEKLVHMSTGWWRFFNTQIFIFFKKKSIYNAILKDFSSFLLVHIYSIFILDSADVALTVSLGKYLQAIGRRPVTVAMDFIFSLPLPENTQFLQNLCVCSN